MESRELKIEPIVANSPEFVDLSKLENLLQSVKNGDRAQGLRIVSPTGEEMEIPESISRLLRQLVPYLAQGKGVMSWIFQQPLTVVEAADLLALKGQNLEQLLDEGQILFIEGRWGRLIELDDLMVYQKKREAFRRSKLDELTEMSQEFGLYSTTTNPHVKQTKELI